MLITREIAEFVIDALMVCQSEGIGPKMNADFYKCLQEEFPDLITDDLRKYTVYDERSDRDAK